MENNRKKAIISAELKSSQWRFLTDIVNDVNIALKQSSIETKSLLALYEIDRLRPLLVSNGGQDFIDPSDGCSSTLASSAIRFQLGERNSFVQPDSVVQDAAARFDYSIPIPVLRKWRTGHSLDFSVEHWEAWTRESFPTIEKAGLLYSDIYVNAFTPTIKPLDPAQDNRAQATVSFTELQKLSGHTRPGDICAWMVRLNIPYELGIRRRPFTTIKAINRALGLENENIPEKQILTL